MLPFKCKPKFVLEKSKGQLKCKKCFSTTEPFCVKSFIPHRTTFSHSRSKQIWKQNMYQCKYLIIKLISDDCTNQGKIFCQQSVKCADGSDDYDVSGNRKGVGCQRRKFVCLNNSVICDGNFDCMPYDDTDEINCKLSPSIIHRIHQIVSRIL